MKKNKDKKKEEKITPEKIKQDTFCFYYASGNSSEHFGNATKSYAIAYGFQEKIKKLEEELVVIPYSKEADRKEKRQAIKKLENICSTSGARLLRNVRIIAESGKYLDKLFDNSHMDRELARAATQNKDIASKVAAIREFNRVKNRVEEKIINNNVTYTWATPKDLRKGAKVDKK